MEVYYYCSYTKSPVGFRLGMVDTEHANGEICELSTENVHPFIWKCFSSGIIRRACGQIPQENKQDSRYFLLMKSRDSVIIDEVEYFINFAFVTSRKQEYEAWFQGSAENESTVLQAIGTTMILNGRSEFGFSVRTDGVCALAGKSYRGLFAGISPSTEDTYLKAVSSKTRQSQLLDTLDLAGYDAQRLNQVNWVCIKKKQPARTAWLIAAIAAAAAAALLLLLSGVGKNTESSSAEMAQEVLKASKKLAEVTETAAVVNSGDYAEGSWDTVSTNRKITDEK